MCDVACLEIRKRVYNDYHTHKTITVFSHYLQLRYELANFFTLNDSFLKVTISTSLSIFQLVSEQTPLSQ